MSRPVREQHLQQEALLRVHELCFGRGQPEERHVKHCDIAQEAPEARPVLGAAEARGLQVPAVVGHQ